MSVTLTNQDDQDQHQPATYPWTSLKGDSEGEKVENWFERAIWHNRCICSHCFARLRTHSELERDDWGNIVEETEYDEAAIEAFDVEAKGVIGTRTVRNDDEQVVDVVPITTHSARYLAFERTACGECGAVGGLAQSGKLSKAEAVDRVPALIERLQELDHGVDVDEVYDAVRSLKSDPERQDDKRIFATAAALGVKCG